jgi:hypothetical protein
MLWFLMMLVIVFAFVITITLIDQKAEKKKPGDKKAAVKKSVKARTGTFDVTLYEVPSAYEDRCFRIEFHQKAAFVHKDIDYLPSTYTYTDVIKHFVKKFDELKDSERSEKQQQEAARFELEHWDGDVYEEDTVEIPKKEAPKS